MGRFDALATQPARGLQHILKWKLEQLFRSRARARAADVPAPVRDNDGAALHAPEPHLTWIGHASFVVRLGGLLVATDPIWSKRAGGFVRRLIAPGVPIERLPPVDLVTVSHDHFDHLDVPTLRRFGPRARFVVPLGVGKVLRRAGLPAERVVELDWWQAHTEGAVSVTLVPSRHWSMRSLWGRNASLWGGFVVRGPEGAFYHSGDTAYFDGFAEIGARAGPIDWALLPIGAYDPRWFMQPQHMCPEEAGEAFLALRARTLVAMHWGTFKLTDEPLREPPERIRRFFDGRDLPRERLWVLDVGETRALVP